MVECTGIEPVVPEAPDLQSSASPLMLPLHIEKPYILSSPVRSPNDNPLSALNGSE